MGRQLNEAIDGPLENGVMAEHKLDAPPVEASLAGVADRHVGARIRTRRVMLGLSQQQLAALIGVTYQQAHKYERGLNRISAGRLFEIAQVLRAPVQFFYEGMDGVAEGGEGTSTQRMGLELARNFAAISNARHREALSAMARALAATDGAPEH